jgi:hypothetical protein
MTVDSNHGVFTIHLLNPTSISIVPQILQQVMTNTRDPTIYITHPHFTIDPLSSILQI